MRNQAQKSITRTLIKHSYLILFLYVTFLPPQAHAFEHQKDYSEEIIKKEKAFHIHPKILGNNKSKHHNRQKYHILDYNNIGIALRFNIDF